MTQQLRGWIDYDRPFLPSLTPGKRVDYFEQRVRLVAVNPLRRILRTEIHQTDSSALLIFGVSLCCVIEATGKFLTGARGNNSQRFHEFLSAYMSPDFSSKKVGSCTYGEALWRHFRNGLAHGFAVQHGGFEGTTSDPYFRVRTIAGRDSLEVNPSLLFDDYVTGFERYLADLRSAGARGALFVNFQKVFKAVFIEGK